MAMIANTTQPQGWMYHLRVIAAFAVCFSLGTLIATAQTNNLPQSAPVASQAMPPEQQPQKQIETLAVVNGQPINREQIAQECLRRFGADVLETIIKKYLVTVECERSGIKITEGDINDEITAEAKKLGWSAERWLEVISSDKELTVDQIKNDYVWNKLALRSLVAKQIEVSQEELDEQMEFEFGSKVQVRQIVLDTAEQAQQMVQVARANPGDFERLAKKHSIDPNSASVGGLLPPIRKNSGLPQFEQAAFALAPEQISDPIQIADKFIVLRCERIFPAEELPEDQLMAVHDRLVSEISNAKMGDAAMDLLTNLQQSAKIQNVMNDPQLSVQMPGVAAIVNGVQIPKNHVAEECIVRYGKDMLETEINRSLLSQTLQKNGMQVAQDDINAEISRAAEALGHLDPTGKVDVDRWLKFVTGNDLAKVDFYIEDEVWPTVAVKKLVESSVSVTEEDMQKGFEANYGPRVEVLAIMTNDHRQSQKVWTMAAANPTAEYFGQLAFQYSIEPASKNNYGQVPPIQRHGGRAELEKEAFNLKVGEISKVVQVGEFWVIMYCQGQTEPVVTEFDAVKDEIHRTILEKKMRLAMYEKFQQIREEAQIDNFLAGTSQTGAADVRSARQTDDTNR